MPAVLLPQRSWGRRMAPGLVGWLCANFEDKAAVLLTQLQASCDVLTWRTSAVERLHLKDSFSDLRWLANLSEVGITCVDSMNEF